MSVRTRLPRLAFALVLATMSVVILARSSLLGLFGADLAALPASYVVGFVLFVPAILARGSPLPSALAALVPVFALGAYGESQLDWLRVLKDFHVTDGGSPDLVRVGLAVAALFVAWTMHAIDFALRMRERALVRDVEVSEANAASRRVLLRAGTRAVLALAGTLLLAGVTLVAAPLDLERILLGRGPLLAPLLAAVLVGVGAYVVAGRAARKRARN